MKKLKELENRVNISFKFVTIDTTKEFFTNFIQLRKEGIVLVCIIVDIKGFFIGSFEVYHIHNSTHDIGI